MLYIPYYIYRKNKNEQRGEGRRDRPGRERNRAKDAADLFASSSPLFRSVCCPHPSTPSPAAHPLARSRYRKREGKDGHPVRFWAMPSPHLDGLPSCPPRPRPLPLRQVVRVGQRVSQGGRSPAAQNADPLHPAGVPRHICGHLRREGRGSCRHIRVAGLIFEKVCFGIFCAVVSL